MVDLATLRARLDLPASVISDEELQEVLDACSIKQAEVILAPMNALTDRALIRRVQRDVSAKGLPLGQAQGEFGTVFVSFRDPIIEEYEAPYLRGGFA